MQMLEKEIIQENGFRNVRKNGQIAGFQVGYRSCYYRSVWLSMSLGFDVTVDGEKFSRDQIRSDFETSVRTDKSRDSRWVTGRAITGASGFPCRWAST